MFRHGHIMSQVYNLEPPCDGKVVFHTSFGDIDIELWPREAPLACRNFIQLCLDGYYDNTIFHRIIAKFMIQGGDPTGVGNGGQSAAGAPFRDEFHSRLKFNHRGILAMANANEVDANASQFFLTLDSCEWLNKKHTIFGKVVGQTMFNLLRMGDVDVGLNDRPVDPPRLERVSVLNNPFEDIVPRVGVGSGAEASVESEAAKRKKKRKKVNDRSLLSFGDEEEVVEPAPAVKMSSMHDQIKRGDAGGRLSSAVAADVAEAATASFWAGTPEQPSCERGACAVTPLSAAEKAAALRRKVSGKRVDGTGGNDGRGDGDDSDGGGGGDADYRELQARMKAQQRQRLEKMRAAKPAPRGEGGLAEVVEDDEHARRADAAAASRKEYKATFKEMKESSAARQAAKVLANAAATKSRDVGLMSELEKQRAKFLSRKKDRDLGARQQDTMAALESFSSKLLATKKRSAVPESHEPAVEGLVTAGGAGSDSDGYHGQVTEGDQLFGR